MVLYWRHCGYITGYLDYVVLGQQLLLHEPVLVKLPSTCMPACFPDALQTCFLR